MMDQLSWGPVAFFKLSTNEDRAQGSYGKKLKACIAECTSVYVFVGSNVFAWCGVTTMLATGMYLYYETVPIQYLDKKKSDRLAKLAQVAGHRARVSMRLNHPRQCW